MIHEIYIVYDSKDKALLHDFAQYVRAHYGVIWDREISLTPEDALLSKISAHPVRPYIVIIAILSENSINSNWVREDLIEIVEHGQFDHCHARPFAISLRPFNREAVPKPLLQYYFAGLENSMKGIIEFLESVKRYERNKYRDHDTLALAEAVNLGKVDTVSMLLDKGMDPNTEIDWRIAGALPVPISPATLLSVAAWYGHINILNLLLDKGAAVNMRSKAEGNALGYAVEGGHLDAVRLLLERGADINLEHGDRTPLIMATAKGREEILRELLNRGADVNRQGESGITALMDAIERDHVEDVFLLLDKGPDVNAKHISGLTALMEAALHGYKDLVRILLEKGADPNAKLRGAQGGGTALTFAAGGHTEVLMLLLEKGADVNERPTGALTALMMAAAHGKIDHVRLLLEAGADVNAQTDDGFTALRAAVNSGNAEVVRALLDSGADVNIKKRGILITDPHTTALAAARERGHSEIARLLEEAGAKD